MLFGLHAEVAMKLSVVRHDNINVITRIGYLRPHAGKPQDFHHKHSSHPCNFVPPKPCSHVDRPFISIHLAHVFS